MILNEEILKDFPVVSLSEGDYLLKQGEKTNSMYFLEDGAVKVIKDGYKIGVSSEHGAVFGEMSILLGNEHSASVKCVKDSKFYHINNPQQYFESHPEVVWHVAQMLSRRIINLNQYFVEVKRHYEGESTEELSIHADLSEHQKMVNDALKILQIQS